MFQGVQRLYRLLRPGYFPASDISQHLICITVKIAVSFSEIFFFNFTTYQHTKSLQVCLTYLMNSPHPQNESSNSSVRSPLHLYPSLKVMLSHINAHVIPHNQLTLWISQFAQEHL